MTDKEINKCPLVGGNIPGIEDAKTNVEKIQILEKYYFTLVEMAYESQRAIGKRIEYLKSLEDTP